MQRHHAAWQEVREKIDVLLDNPRMFAWKYGNLYDVETKEGKRVRQVVQVILGLVIVAFAMPLTILAFCVPVYLLFPLLEALGMS